MFQTNDFFLNQVLSLILLLPDSQSSNNLCLDLFILSFFFSLYHSMFKTLSNFQKKKKKNRALNQGTVMVIYNAENSQFFIKYCFLITRLITFCK